MNVSALTTIQHIDHFVLDSEDAVMNVSGYVDLAKESFDVDVEPKSKGARILILHSDYQAQAGGGPDDELECAASLISQSRKATSFGSAA